MSQDPSGLNHAEVARELLRYKMMEYSQDGFCATWLVDLEWELWTGAERIDPTPQQQPTVDLSRELRTLAEIAGGWWVYEDETIPTEDGPVFVPMEHWQEILSKRNASP